jgi:predicted CXXCH cytochrome family protein
MASIKYLKLVMLGSFALLLFAWVAITFTAPSMQTSASELPDPIGNLGSNIDDRFVGSETCKACHEDRFNEVARTTHGKLHERSSWKDKVVGCESCHGPGKEHVEGGGDKTKIINPRNLDPKAASESCLACHAGKESHNNFRRGDHWRNNVSCNDCHSAHGPNLPNQKLGSTTFIGEASAQRANLANKAMLKNSEPQLCISCHSEVKAQFSKPFRHKVLEGTMTCSDCHNPHGGFDQKQTKLAVGADQTCVKCHTNKQGPFVFEHATLKLEGCSSCHTPHGSSNPKMLKRSSIRQLCIECHTNILGVETPDSENPGGPHGQNSIRSQNCTICHAAIHGSNTSRVFFR